MASSIQFRGIDAVVEAYSNRDVPAWSLWQGKQFMFKHEGNDIAEGANQLHQTLEMLKDTSNAIYTLKVYEDWKQGQKIKNNTPDDGSFNFKIDGEAQVGATQYYQSRNTEMLAVLNKINDRLDTLEEEKEIEPEQENKLGVIGDIISHPVLSPIIQGFVQSLLANATKRPEQSPAASPQATMQRAVLNGIDESEIRLNEALSVLKQHDDKLPEHLAKLAKIAASDKNTFNFLLSTLDNIEL